MEREIDLNREVTRLDLDYAVMAVDPYALNVDLVTDSEGNEDFMARMSYYSHQMVHFAERIHAKGRIKRVVVFGDASFGPDFPSTGDLMAEHFTERGGIPAKDIVPFNGSDQNQTSTQLKRLSEFMRAEGLEGQPVLYPVWKYHEERVQNHAKGYGVNVVTAPIEELYQTLGIGYDFQKMVDMLPLEEAEAMESGFPWRRQLSRIDKKGLIPRLAKPILGGSFMIDNQVGEDGRLEFEYKPGKKKLKELGFQK